MKLTTNEISLKMAPQTFTNHNSLNFYIPFAVCFETAWSVCLPKIPFHILLLAPVRCAPFPIVPSLFKQAMILGLFDTASQTIFLVVFINILVFDRKWNKSKQSGSWRRTGKVTGLSGNQVRMALSFTTNQSLVHFVNVEIVLQYKRYPDTPKG